jgi:hypothetical protein
VSAWLVASLTLLGAILLGIVKADLEDEAVCRWLARKLIYRAALRLPRRERARWREESMRDVLDLPGRLPPLVWALDIYIKAGRWGQLRGGRSRWQALIDRIRAVDEVLSAEAERRAWKVWMRLRAKRREPTVLTPSELVEAAAEFLEVKNLPLPPGQLAASGMTRSSGTATLERDSEVWALVDEARNRRRLHPDDVFDAWLAMQRREFEASIDRRVQEYWQRRPHLPGLDEEPR